MSLDHNRVNTYKQDAGDITYKAGRINGADVVKQSPRVPECLGVSARNDQVKLLETNNPSPPTPGALVT